MSYTIDDFKASFKELVEKFTAKAEKFIDAKLQDGSIVRVEADAFQVGQAVLVVDENGTAPLMDGKYVLETGEMLVVEGGLIKEFTPKSEEPAAAPQEEMSDATQTATASSAPAQPKRYIERVEKEHIFEHVKEICKEDFEKITNEVNEKFEAVKAENESLKSEISKSKELMDAMFELVTKFANAPSEKSKVVKKDEFKAKAKNVFLPSAEDIEGFRKKYNY